MRHRFSVQVGAVGFRIGSAWRGPIAALERLYVGYPKPDVPDMTVRLFPEKPWRRFARPSVAISGDFWLPDAAPLPLRQGLLAAEMGMNLQVALGWRRHLLLHCSAVERDGRVLLMSGASGSGKSTLATMLALRGWRFLGDEFAFVDLEDGRIHPFPRASSLKNEAVAAVRSAGGAVGPVLEGTPKGMIGYWRPPEIAIARMTEAAPPAMLLFPRFGRPENVERLAASETFMLLTQASTNYVSLGEAGFGALTRLVQDLPALAIDYPDGEAGMMLVDRLWGET
ncbi:HprK-related kinase A [Sphingomonas sp. CGMCC 1.13654]|uniref:HprK-related kinase A n=1 Tax=Sphingomonas chungangi TaxID=2683589 RepID=A0A838L9L0_9SPHN|nr:HprK-related kinase A [Sphingomonas chungangi]MBA2936123.1 HprK-related kinase A [Sphingomonas chungangi]MVW55510.1 HprK-related kinase A [Sphingomonas chungangi]